MKKLPHTRWCFVCGESNPVGLRLTSETDGQIVQLRFTPAPEHVGFKQTIHGGLIATVLDETMVWACAVQTKRFAFCAELNVRFLLPLRPREEVAAVARFVENRRNKLFLASAELRNQSGTVFAAASGKYLPLKEDLAAEMAADFVADPGWVLGRGGKLTGGAA